MGLSGISASYNVDKKELMLGWDSGFVGVLFFFRGCRKKRKLTLGTDLDSKRLSDGLGEEVGVGALNAKATEGSLSDGTTKVTH